jgi:hypothetical protein
MRLALMGTLALLGTLAACGGSAQDARPDDGEPELVESVEAAAPAFSQELADGNGQLLSPDDVIAADGQLLLLDDDELFTLALSPPHQPRLISELRRFGQQAVFAMATHPRGISLLGVDGQLRVMEPDAPQRLARTLRVFAAGHRPIVLGAVEGDWIAAHAVVTPTGGSGVLDSVIVSQVDSQGRVRRRAGFERVGPSRPDAFLRDRLSARMVGAAVVMTGSDPARVIQLGSASEQTDTLDGAPRRAMNARERAGLRRLLASPSTPPFVRDAAPPEVRPAALAALPVDGGFLVVAQLGEEAQGVDLYCGRRFRRTVLARPGLRRVFVAGGIVAVDEPVTAASEGPARLSLYRPEDLAAECRP